jgi:F420-dependent oxidoreductase-like protein
VLECWVTLGALAAATTRLRLGALVSGIPYRNPALLAKMGATLDVISHGRCIMGIGAGWHREEFDAYGYAFETAAVRGARLAEAAQVVRAMLSQQRTTFAGRYYQITDAYNEPRPIQQPHPPLLIGGNGEKVTLRVVAQYGDMCNLTGTPGEVQQRLEILREHCRAVGRPYEEITRTIFTWLLIGRTEEEATARRARYMQREPFPGIAGTPRQIVGRLREYAAAGVQEVLFSMPDAHEIEPLRLFGEEVLPALADA